MGSTQIADLNGLLLLLLLQVPFTFGVEVFEPGHVTKPHSHSVAHEMFLILAGDAHVALTSDCDTWQSPHHSRVAV